MGVMIPVPEKTSMRAKNSGSALRGHGFNVMEGVRIFLEIL